MSEREPAASRLCVATAAHRGCPLRTVVAAGEFYRMHVATDPADGTEFAVAAPGIDEVSLIADLIAALRDQAMIVEGPGVAVLAGFHVGIVRLSRSSFSGNGITRVRALLRHPAIVERVPAGVEIPREKPWLAMAITSGLFEDLRAEGLPDDGWQHIGVAGAWLRHFTATADRPDRTDPASRRNYVGGDDG
jgi:hypothetical protein